MVTLEQTNDFLIQAGVSAPLPQMLEGVPPGTIQPEPEPDTAKQAKAQQDAVCHSPTHDSFVTSS
jgi:hypothetical protein